MKSEEKSTNKEKQTLIIRKYHQYLKLEKALSPNTVDAYQTDLQKLLHFLEGEGIAILDTTLDDLQHFASGLHDIGIHAAEAKYRSAAGIYQEKEGPAPARKLLEDVSGIPSAMIERICYLIGHHHTYKDVDGADYQLLLEADFLVNAYEDALSQKAILAFREKVFRTASGTAMLNAVYGLD